MFISIVSVHQYDCQHQQYITHSHLRLHLHAFHHALHHFYHVHHHHDLFLSGVLCQLCDVLFHQTFCVVLSLQLFLCLFSLNIDDDDHYEDKIDDNNNNGDDDEGCSALMIVVVTMR